MPGNFVTLAQSILKDAQALEKYFDDNDLPEPSFDAASYPEPEVPMEVTELRKNLINTSWKLNDLVRGPKEIVRNNLQSVGILSSLRSLHTYGVPRRVPTDKPISYHDLSVACGMDKLKLKTFMRYTMSHHIFSEPQSGFVAHSAASKAWAEERFLDDYVGMCTDDIFPALAKMDEAMKKWPNSQETTETGFNLALDTEEPFFLTLAKYPGRTERFANAMTYMTRIPALDVKHLVDGYPWNEVAAGEKAVFVDVGGSHGHMAFALAKAHPQMHCIIQDLPEVVVGLTAPQGLEERVDFKAHDFFTEQKVVADVYFFRWIFHDWPEKYCLKILRNLIPALKPGARILINDICLPPPGLIPTRQDKELRVLDMCMSCLSNARERDIHDWTQLFHEADSRFQFNGAKTVPHSAAPIMEAVWKG